MSVIGFAQRTRARRLAGSYSGGSTTLIIARALRLGTTRAGVVLTGAVILIAVLGPAFAPHSATALVGPPLKSSAPGLPFGTDFLGRDVLSRFLDGGRQLLLLSFLAATLGVGIGAIVGGVAAYTRGIVDELLMRLSDVALAFPQIMLMLLLVSVGGSHGWLLVLAVGVGHVPQTARVIRGVALAVIDREFVQHDRAVGQPTWRILTADVLPNVTSALMVEFGLRLSFSVALLAGASFLGFGVQPPGADWGLMIDENTVGLATAPWAVVLPVMAIAALTVGINLVADGISQAAVGIDE